MKTHQPDLLGNEPVECASDECHPATGLVERCYKAGISRDQPDLIGYRLEDFVDEDNEVRAIDAYVESLDLTQLGFTNTLPNCGSGQPAYSPAMLLKLYLYGYQNRIRSTRHLARECLRNVEVMWLLERLSPEYRTIGDFRARNAEPIRRAHRQFIELCRHLGLLSDSRVSVDGSHFKGNVSAKSFRKKEDLSRRNEVIDKEIDSWLKQVEQTDAEESDMAQKKIELNEALQKLEAEKAQNIYLLEQLEEKGFNHISRTDIDAQRMSKPGSSGQGYNVQIAVEGKSLLIAADDVISNANDREALFSMAESAKEALGVETLAVYADQGYSSGKQFAQCYENGITPYVPVMTSRSIDVGSRFKRAMFSFDKERDVYVCPMGELLYPSGKPKNNGAQNYCSRKATCDECAKRDKCLTKKAAIRKLLRSEHEELLSAQRQHMSKHPTAMRERSSMVEHPFGTIKVRAGWHHFLVRGLEKVKGEWSLMGLGYNLSRVVKLLGIEKFIECCRNPQAQMC